MPTPKYNATPERREQVRQMVAAGRTQEDIIAVLGISLPTLHKYYRRELDTALPDAVRKMDNRLFDKGMAGDTIAMIYWLKTHGGPMYREMTRLVGDEDSAAIQVSFRWADATPGSPGSSPGACSPGASAEASETAETG